MSHEARTGAALVLGARNLGGAILGHLLDRGWRGAAVARSEDSLASARERGGVAIEADATDPDELDRAIAEARDALGGLDLIVNAVSASRRPEGEPFGGGPLAEATLEGFRGWSTAVAEQSFVFLSRAARAMRASGGGTLVQVTGGSSRRAIPGKGPWAAGSFATRALVQAAAQELREEGIRVALLVVDATIESPKTSAMTRDTPTSSLARQEDVAAAVEFLATRDARAMTHELVVTPAGDRWVP
jgi:NAD(P)-dependent dehydrogenase (short-subunit alcohol dehydrogenase family)